MVNPAALLGLGLAGAVIAVVPALSAKTPTCPDHVVRDESGNGSSVCLAAHSDVTIMLTAAAGSSWSEPAAAGHVLGPARGLPTPHGLVGWSFRADIAGRTEITTSGRSCTAVASCHDVVYRLHVTVR